MSLFFRSSSTSLVQPARFSLRNISKACIVYAVSGALVLASLPFSTAPAYAQNTAPIVAMQECINLNDPEIRRHLRDLTGTTLSQELGAIDYTALVEKHWRETNISVRLDAEVDAAVLAVRTETGILDRAYSTISRTTAEKMAKDVAERTFNSEGFKAAVSDLALALGKDFGARIENASTKVTSPVIDCVRAGLQTRYGGAIAQVFTKETQENAQVTPEVGGAKIGTSDLVIDRSGSIAGIALIVTRRVIARMVTTMGRRVAGLVASRIAATFTGLVGLGLLLNDLYEATDGVFPLVSERMKSDESKNLIKEEITKSIETDLKQQMGAITDETADRIYSFWMDFKQKYATLINLAEKNEAFSTFLKDRKIDQLGRLGQIVSLILGQEGEAGVFKHTNDGSLARAMLDLDDVGVAVALSTKSVDKALAWTKLAGRKLAKAAEYGLPQVVDPADLTENQFNALMNFDERTLAVRVAQLDRAARDAILTLPTQNLKDLVRRLDEKELTALAGYMMRLQQAAAARILRAVVDDPQVIKTLTNSSIQNALINSRDQLSAINMLLRENSLLSITNIGSDFSLVREGQVHYRVFLERYWIALLVMLSIMLLILLWLRRLIVGRSTTVVIKTEGGKQS